MTQKTAIGLGCDPLGDKRQSRVALEIARGAGRCLLAYGFARITEMSLANGRRADLVAINRSGRIWIVEVKSSVADFKSDQKWEEYSLYCDQFFFAVGRDFPTDILPHDAGLIIADAYGGEVIRQSPEHSVPAARRKDVTLRFGRHAALRLHALVDPESNFDL
jgi:hypothetical protein